MGNVNAKDPVPDGKTDYSCSGKKRCDIDPQLQQNEHRGDYYNCDQQKILENRQKRCQATCSCAARIASTPEWL